MYKQHISKSDCLNRSSPKKIEKRIKRTYIVLKVKIQTFFQMGFIIELPVWQE